MLHCSTSYISLPFFPCFLSHLGSCCIAVLCMINKLTVPTHQGCSDIATKLSLSGVGTEFSFGSVLAIVIGHQLPVDPVQKIPVDAVRGN